MFNIKIKKLHEDAIIPQYQSESASGVDLHALEDTYGVQGEVVIVRTGIAIDMSEYEIEAQIRPRSGLAVHGITVVNSPGTIDADYTGELKIIMTNFLSDLVIKKGERVAQLVFVPVVQVQFKEVDELGETDRGSAGMGSTGV